MTPKPLAVFTAEFPDDFVFEGRKIVQMGGRNVAEEIRAMVAKLGCETSTLMDGGYKGWGFTIDFKGQGFWCHLRSYYPAYYLVFANLASRGARGPLSKDPTYAELWHALNATLQQDPRFHDLQWVYNFKEAPPPPDAWFGWALGVRKPPGFLARFVARPFGWVMLVIAVVTLLDFVSPSPVVGVAYLVVSAVLLSIGYKVSHVFGVRLPWVRLP